MDFYLSATGETTHEIVIQRSRFICTLKRIDGFDDALSFVKSVKKKFKDKAFADKCSREVIRQGCEMLGMELSEVVALCIQGMQTVAGELGLGAKQPE